MKRFTIHYIAGMKECWTMWSGSNEEDAEETFIMEYPMVEILDIAEVNDLELH